MLNAEKYILVRDGVNGGDDIFGVNDISAELGTFSDSKKAPIHRWFQYPAGFSYKAVNLVCRANEITAEDIVYDPFVGTGTTVVECKRKGIPSIGVEAHPLVWEVAKNKVNWDIDSSELYKTILELKKDIDNGLGTFEGINIAPLPELLYKCFSEDNLKKLLFIKYAIDKPGYELFRGLFTTTLVCALRRASKAATGWPYISPKHVIAETDAFDAFKLQLKDVYEDLVAVAGTRRRTKSDILLEDARKTDIKNDSVDLVFTSPPYLNNYDYADRTRLESYFVGFANSWGEITRKVRDKLIIAATTQIRRTEYEVGDIVSDTIREANTELAGEIQKTVDALSEIRNRKAGKKSYDIMVGQYFNDMAEVLSDCYRVLKKGSCFILILGDSAPYGVHVPTETILAKLGISIGFNKFTITELRKRGDKWKANPQRHKVKLRESILTLKK